MSVETFPVGPIGCNCVVLGCPVTHQALVVDPGGDLPMILAALDRGGYRLKTILHTHAHFDHLLATAELKAARGGEILLHRDDDELYRNANTQGAMFGLSVPEPPAPDRYVKEGDELRWGQIVGQVMHTPGHSPGSICLYVPQEQAVITGDTLFAGGIGRTDLWGGSEAQIMRSIRERLLALPDATAVLPGHGETTTVGYERTHNPFLRG